MLALKLRKGNPALTNDEFQDLRLIERWLPIAALGVESIRERTPMTPLPAPNRLDVWWARRPLVASRAAIFASLLPVDTDQEKFMHTVVEDRLQQFFPQPTAPDQFDLTYLWARTIGCPYCAGLVPLSPNWCLAEDGTGVRLIPSLVTGLGADGQICSFEIVNDVQEHSSGLYLEGLAFAHFLMVDES